MIALKNRRVVIIGGAGFIGHNMALSLSKAGADVSVIDSLQVNNLLYYSSNNIDPKNRELYLKILNQRLDLLREAKVPLYTIDARDYHALSRTLSDLKPQVIVHLAAIAHANRSNKDPFSTFDHSLRTLENALDNARAIGVEHFIYFSSSMVYGNFMTPEVTEDHPLNPIGIYGALKLAGEKMVIAYQQVFKLPYTIIRPSALYGPRCVSGRVGQIYIQNALRGEALRVDGDGCEKIDFTHIDDLVQGVTKCIENPASQNQIFNVTYGQSRQLNDLVKIVQKSFAGAKVEYTERDKLIPFRGALLIDRARKLVGYEPQNPVEVGFPKYIEWYKEMFKTSPEVFGR